MQCPNSLVLLCLCHHLSNSSQSISSSIIDAVQSTELIARPPAFDPARLFRPSEALRPLSGIELVEFGMTVDAAIRVCNEDVSAPIRD